MKTEEFAGKRLGICGFGKEGQAVAAFLNVYDLSALVIDKNVGHIAAEEKDVWQGRGFSFVSEVEFLRSNVQNIGLLFRSPGVPLFSAGVQHARQAGAAITSQTIWFFQQCPCPIIGVTGTKGKGTTASLIYEMIRAAHGAGEVSTWLQPQGKVFLTGNIGKEDPLALLSRLQREDLVVFELSSFQLQDLPLSPSIGVCLMVTTDHLDIHRDVSEYHAAKASIAHFQRPGDFLIYNADYPATNAIGQLGGGKKLAISSKQRPAMGCYINGDKLEVSGFGHEAVFDLTVRQLRGRHNLENLAAAALVAMVLQISLRVIAATMREFAGLEHRLEFVGNFGGLAFYNDSISTTPDSSIAAIAAFTEPVILILGGSEKHADFSGLAAAVCLSAHVRAVILIGQTAERLVSALRAAGFAGKAVTGARSMTEVFQQIAELARTGDVVLLSPACASFDMFDNYADRGRQFCERARQFTGATVTHEGRN